MNPQTFKSAATENSKLVYSSRKHLKVHRCAQAIASKPAILLSCEQCSPSLDYVSNIVHVRASLKC